MVAPTPKPTPSFLDAAAWICDGHTVHKLCQRRLTADWLAPWESDCWQIHSTVSSDWLPSYIKTTRPVLEIFKMDGYFPDRPRICTCIEVPHVQTVSGDPPSLLPSWYRGSFLGLKGPGRDVDSFSLCSTEATNWWSYIAAPPICRHGTDTGNFACALTGIKMWGIAGIQNNAASLRNFSIGQLHKLPA